ncbi:MAG: hypothetical protein ACRDZR_02235 [Acidimicrobiales bacterium]
MTPVALALDLIRAAAAEDDVATARLMHDVTPLDAVELVGTLAEVGAVFAKLAALLDRQDVGTWLAGLGEGVAS